jgi:hypothetical protein
VAVTMMIILAATMAATAVRVGRGAPLGSKGGGGPGVAAAGQVDGGGEHVRGCITLRPPLPAATGIGGGGDLSSVAAVVVVVVAVTMVAVAVAVAVERGGSGGG